LRRKMPFKFVSSSFKLMAEVFWMQVVTFRLTKNLLKMAENAGRFSGIGRVGAFWDSGDTMVPLAQAGGGVEFVTQAEPVPAIRRHYAKIIGPTLSLSGIARGLHAFAKPETRGPDPSERRCSAPAR
jgi:hypothetical protein